MAIVLTFVANAGLNFLLGLAVAAVLGPEEYGRFAVGFMIAIVIATALFEWLRLAATRFYSNEARQEDPALRASLESAFAALSLILAGAVLAVFALGLDVRLPAAMVAAAAITAIANARVDFDAALARARFMNTPYVRLVLIRNGAAFVLMVGAGLVFQNATAVLAAMAVSSGVALLFVHWSLADRDAIYRLAEPARLVTLARYGLPVIAANVVYQLVVLINRSWAAASLGYAEAGQLSLATDVSIRLLLATAAALDVFLFQLVVAREASEGRQAAEAQLSLNNARVTAVLVLLGVGYAAALPAFAALLVPGRYSADFAWLSLILTPGIVMFCLVQVALGPIFQLQRRTWPLTVAALAGLATDLAAQQAVPGADTAQIAAIHAGSLGMAFLVACGFAIRHRECHPAFRDIAVILLAGLITGAALWPTRDIAQPWLALLATLLIGVSSFGAVLALFNAAGARNLARLAIGRLRTRAGGHQ